MIRRVLLLLAIVAVASTVRAEDRIWAALVLGCPNTSEEPVPKELEPFIGGLKTVFGYKTFYLLNAKEKKIREGTEEWIVPRKQIFLKVRCTDRDKTSYTVVVELYVKKQLLVTSEVRLAREAPLYIRGPNWGKGRLVFILEVR